MDGDATPAEPTTPKPVTKRGRPTKAKVPATPNEDGEAPATAPKSSAKRGAAKTADGETPSKKPKAAPKTPKAAAAPKAGFPTCWEEFSEEDKLIVTMRRDKAAWQEIEAALEKITGNKPGKDVTRKKYAKLEAVATIFAPGDVSLCSSPFFLGLVTDHSFKVRSSCRRQGHYRGPDRRVNQAIEPHQVG